MLASAVSPPRPLLSLTSSSFGPVFALPSLMGSPAPCWARGHRVVGRETRPVLSKLALLGSPPGSFVLQRFALFPSFICTFCPLHLC